MLGEKRGGIYNGPYTRGANVYRVPLGRHRKEAQAEDQIGQVSSRNKESRLIAETQPSNIGGACIFEIVNLGNNIEGP